MKTKSFIVGMLLVALIPVFAATNDLTSALQKGLFEEEANHNLDAAAQAYQAVSAQFDKDRKLAATAIFRLGEVYRKQGKTNEATAQYERIVREFSDQQTLVTLSRQNLAGLGEKKEAPSSSPLSRAARLEQKKLLEDEIKLVEQDLAELRKQVEVGRATQTEVRAKEREVLKLRQQVAALNVDADDVAVGTSAGTPVTDEEEKEIRRIQEMIRNSPDLINAIAEGRTPLSRAAYLGQLRVAKFLLDAGAAVDPAADLRATGLSPIHTAAAGGHKAMVELLLDRGADVNARDSSGRSPIHTAAENGFQSVVETLLARKAEMNAQTKKQETPLRLAAAQGHSAMVDLLIAKGAQLDAKDARGWTALTTAADQGHSLVVKRLLVARADPNITDGTGRTALSHGVQRGQADTVKALLEGKADPNAGSADSPLLLAVRADSAGLAELLLRADADPNQPTDCATVSMGRRSDPPGFGGGAKQRLTDARNRGKRTPLQAAVLEEYPAMTKLLLQFKGDAKAKNDGGYPLVLDALNNAEMLKALLDAGADANARYEKGPYALIVAAGSENSAAVELLVNHGADVTVRDESGGPPLHISSERGDKKSVELLLNGKADVNAAMTGGLLTALHRAAYIGSEEIAEMLLAHGANPNLKDNTGNTPLHWALGIGGRGIGSAKMVELLLSKGADPNLRNNEGRTALDLVKGVNSPPAPGSVLLGPPPGIPTRTVRQPAVSGSPAKTEPVDLATLLREHGALDDLPRVDRMEIRRASANFSAVVFAKGTNDWNQFSLLELIACHYGLISDQRSGDPQPRTGQFTSMWPKTAVRFPDFKKLVIHRPPDGRSWTTIPVNVADILASGDCSRDVMLRWGDVVEIPEADHPVTENWPGLADPDVATLIKCVARTVTVAINRTNAVLKLSPELVRNDESSLKPIDGRWLQRGEALLRTPSFMLRSVLDHSKLVRFSSDLTSVKVAHHDPATGQTRDLLLDCNDPSQSPDLWLRDGDVIEVPEKPSGGSAGTGRIYISGAVRIQGPIVLTPDGKLTVAKAILQAGGFADLANKKKVRLVRPVAGDGGTKKEFELDLIEILEKGKIEQDIELQADDLIIVPNRAINY